MEESSTISVRRIEKWVAKLRRVAVKIDGEQIGTLKNGEEKTFSVTPGEHSIRIEAPWIASNTMEFSVASGETAPLDYEDLSNVNNGVAGAMGATTAVLSGVFAAIGLPSVTPFVAGAAVVLGGYWFLRKFSVVSPIMTFETQLTTRTVESTLASES